MRSMSIDKEGSGLPEVNVHRRTTKVNLSVIGAVLLFFAVAACVAFWFSQRHDSTDGRASAPTESR
jgi:hypothetical protein